MELLDLPLLCVQRKEDSQSFVKQDSTPGASSLTKVCVCVCVGGWVGVMDELL